MPDTAEHEVSRALDWRNRLLLVWLVSLPVGYVVLYWAAERSGPLGAGGSGDSQALVTALFLLAWSAAVLGSGLIAHLVSCRTELWLTRIAQGRAPSDPTSR